MKEDDGYKIGEAYDTLKEAIADIYRVMQSLSQWEERQLIDKYRNGLGAINLICLKVIAEAEVAQRVGKNINLTLEDRREIVDSIIGLGQYLAKIFESTSMNSLLGKNSSWLMKFAG